MAIELIGQSGLAATVGKANELGAFQSLPGYPANGGYYSVAGKSGAGSIAALIAADTTLVSVKFSSASLRKAYITGIRVLMAVVNAGGAGGVPNTLGIQKFSGGTPSGGTVRTPSRFGLSKGLPSDMTDIRDNNAFLTMTGVTFGEEVAWSNTAVFGASIALLEWEALKLGNAPLELAANNGICLRTRVDAGPATATWYFSYTIHWFEE